MIINNTHVQGIFLYSDDIEFEKGDFVVLDNIIYICTAKNPTNTESMTVLGKNPEKDRENFDIYLGDKIESAEEYFKYVENPNDLDDKYVSSHSLTRILSYYMSGYNEKGIISSIIDLDGSNLSYSTDLDEYLDGKTKDNALNAIIKAKDLNNAIFKISRDLVSKTLLPEIDISESSGFSEDDLNSVILKQYTYIDSGNSGILYRVQELIDHVNGIVLYRYTNKESDYTVVSEWKSSFLDNTFKNKVDMIRVYYENKERNLEREKNNLYNNFGFRNSNIVKGQTVSLQCDNKDNSGYIDVDYFNEFESCVITVIIQEQVSSTTSIVFKNTSLTIDLSDSLSSDGILDYYVTSTNTLTVSPEKPSNTKLINLSVVSGRIINVYYRQFYKNE